VRGALVDWLYVNYADGASQDPLATVGAGNAARLRDAARRYDPDGVFQTRCPGVFKISRSKAGQGEEEG
jgi:hypothetical protein